MAWLALWFKEDSFQSKETPTLFSCWGAGELGGHRLLVGKAEATGPTGTQAAGAAQEWPTKLSPARSPRT